MYGVLTCDESLRSSVRENERDARFEGARIVSVSRAAGDERASVGRAPTRHVVEKRTNVTGRDV